MATSPNRRGSASRRGWGRVRRLPSGRWQARFPDAATGRLVAAPGTFPTKADADRWLAHQRTRVDLGLVQVNPDQDRPLRAWWPAYISTAEARLRPATLLLYERAWARRVEPVFGDVPVGRIKSTEIDRWIADLSKSGLSASKVRESHGVLRRLLDMAARDGAIMRNPADQRARQLPRVHPVERPVLTPRDIEDLAAFLPDPSDLLVRLLAFGGLRIGEAFALRRRDFDLARDQVVVSRTVSGAGGETATKTHAARRVTLPASLARELERHLAQLPAGASSVVFASAAGTPLSYGNFRQRRWDPAVRAWNHDRAERGLVAVELTPHDLRSVCASLLIDAGASVKDVQAHLGHADVTTTLSLYARVSPTRHVDLAARAEALLVAHRGTAER